MRRFIIVSDIHACSVDPASSAAPSYVSSFNASASGKADPLNDLERLIREENLAPDVLLCAGDITNRSDPGSLNYAWQKLHQLANSCGVPLVGTVGNHDIDSRYQTNKYDPRGYAMSLTPTIPAADRNSFLEFWAENFTLISDKECNILVLNTSAYHGGGKEVGVELEHGRVSEITIAAIRSTLSRAPQAPINLLLCHHHPIKGDQGDHELTGQTRGGEKLVEILGNTDMPWLIVHGHKHVSDLLYGQGGANSPVILACASFSAQVNADAQNKNPNQVHLLTCDPDGAKQTGLTSAGQVASWTWQPGVGWRKSQGIYGLAHLVGFGYRGNVVVLADQVDSHLKSNQLSHTSWDGAVRVLPSLQWLIPTDFSALERALESRGLVILRERDGSLAQVGRRS